MAKEPEQPIDNYMTDDRWWPSKKRDRDDEDQPGSDEDERYEEKD